jgi:hypothetical protein
MKAECNASLTPLQYYRTLKADVCVGLEAGTAERLDKEDPTWRVSGKYAVVAFSPRQ